VNTALLGAPEMSHPGLDTFECRHDVEAPENDVAGMRCAEVGRQGKSGVEPNPAQRVEQRSVRRTESSGGEMEGHRTSSIAKWTQ
jgi:hypothetical protein